MGFVKKSSMLSWVRTNGWHLDLERLDHVTDEELLEVVAEVATLDVFHSVVVLRVVRDVARALAVRGELGWSVLGRAKPTHELAQVDHVLKSLGECNDLCLPRRLIARCSSTDNNVRYLYLYTRTARRERSEISDFRGLPAARPRF
jgi:hypothetical protein